MESISLGELILDHYEKFLGDFEDVFFKGIDDMPSIQILQYSDIFKGCKTYASYGLSKYSNVIGNSCEVIISVDDDYEKAATLFTHSLLLLRQLNPAIFNNHIFQYNLISYV